MKTTFKFIVMVCAISSISCNNLSKNTSDYAGSEVNNSLNNANTSQFDFNNFKTINITESFANRGIFINDSAILKVSVTGQPQHAVYLRKLSPNTTNVNLAVSIPAETKQLTFEIITKNEGSHKWSKSLSN